MEIGYIYVGVATTIGKTTRTFEICVISWHAIKGKLEKHSQMKVKYVGRPVTVEDTFNRMWL